MTPAQWYAYGGCPTCEAHPARPCTTARFGIGDDLEAPHPARPLYAAPADIARLLDDVVKTSVREGVTVHRGDTLVIRIDPEPVFPDQLDTLTGELEAIRAYVESRLPMGARCLIVAAPGELGVVRAEVTPDDPDAHPTVDHRRS